MDPHPLANLFKRSSYDEPIASEFCALDYLYEVLLEIRESENCDSDDLIEISLNEHDACYSCGHDANIYEDEFAIVPYVKHATVAIAPILDSSFDEKHDCNVVIVNYINVNFSNNMQNPKLGDASFAMSTTCYNDRDWGDSSYDLENLFKPHDEYEIDNNVCNNIESGFGRVSTLDPTYFENVQSYEIFDKSGFGEVMTLFNVIPLFWKSVNFACMWIVLKIFYVIAILLNFLMISHVIIMREENMIVEIFTLLNYLSLC